MYRIFPRVFFFVMCCNLGVFMMGVAFGSTIIEDPFTSTSNIVVEDTDFPAIYNGTNSTGTFYENISQPNNATGAGGDGSPFQFIPDYFEIPFSALWYLIQFLTGGFVFSGIAEFGFPDYATWAFQTAVGFWAIYTFAYYIIGRG